jgi:HAD superfamily hydrolase (TIGR01509 family)
VSDGGDPASAALEAVVFDLDGVLVDSESVWDAARQEVVARTGGSWRPGASEAMIGMSAPEWSRYMQAELGVPLAPEQINERVVASLVARYRRELPLLAGARAAVSRLGSRWPLGLASSANRVVIEAVLARANLAASFATVVSAEEVARGKPAPDVYIAASERLGVSARRTAAVEDSSNGLRAAHAAGMTVVAVPNREFPPSADALALADLVLDSLDELTVESLLSAGR